ncbi:protein of unknown function [Nocardioides scoriae]|uniref:ATP-dependent helicase YprA, contains C-terminal metal-binding DUF1998 domain n=1 Tax=Nocardioides scoriae TaxID=642780 RepID=A0A1H1V0Y2_9ACTN|nr:DEAD/DEAH box helicase [Nocardioides scoriae]SDS78395.1 protein of unknown function [Nocardioides scoriae]
MGELLPTVQARAIREGLLDYLGTTLSLADEDARATLLDFLSHPDTGIFKGPYLRLRLPFEPAADGWRDHLGWYEGFSPYGHQAETFARLTSLDLGPDQPRPLPTVLTTGTGSGKTEAFLHPILDHVLRAKRVGEQGTKALLLYPMNALANDQAGRLAEMITTHEALAGVTAALYTGQAGPTRTKVSADSLITDRDVIRSSAPDILLTNYKMLDQLLLRHADARIWEQSALSLRYLVLDEFHTYDGAQGTDVAMLLRRLGLTLKSHWPDSHADLTDDDRDRPLGRITPVATSATLGGEGDGQAIADFATTVFGEPIGADCVVTESRVTAEQWEAPSLVAVSDAGVTIEDSARAARDVAAAVDALGQDPTGEAITAAVAGVLFPDRSSTGLDDLDLFRAHPLTGRLIRTAAAAADVADLADVAVAGAGLEQEEAEAYLLCFVAALSHLRAAHGRVMPSIELHLWIRELSRLDRSASLDVRYRWFDDGEIVQDEGVVGSEPWFPSLFCRHCGRSGWGVALAPTGTDLDTDDDTIRKRALAKDERFRAVLLALPEAEAFSALDDAAPVEGLRWFHTRERRFLTAPPTVEADLREGRVLPVLMHVGDEAGKASKDDTCPSCRTRDAIRFVGSAVATQLSVTLSTLFGDPHLDPAEKKALVFTDSVQDAAHRAGFVQSRSHGLTLRSVLRSAVNDHPRTLDALVDRVIESAGDDRQNRHRILPPDLAGWSKLRGFWEAATLARVTPKVRTMVRRRLLLDAVLEFGLQSRVGRTLERTGSVTAHVDVPEATLLAAARQAVADAGGTGTLGAFAPEDTQLVQWARGVLERMRERGAIEHEWFRRYVDHDGARYHVWGGRPKGEGMPAFPAGRAAPGYPRVGGEKLTRDVDLDPVTTPRSWYAVWAGKVLGTGATQGATLARLLLERLAKRDVLLTSTSQGGATIYQISATKVLVQVVPDAALGSTEHLLVCDACQAHTPGSPLVTAQLEGAPCDVARCAGRRRRAPLVDNFYRRMYAAKQIQRVLAREHTSLLDDETRLAYENGFKSRADDPEAPNVLVATPTLEMGIDIGDLSTVMLASLPRSVAAYLQRVGRAGRLTGNALDLAFVRGRGDQLPQLGEPLSMINGQVRPPATYLDAEEILRRQYVASLADRLARRGDAPHPTTATEAMEAPAVGTYLHALVVDGEQDLDHLDAFLHGFPSLTKEAEKSLRDWVTPGSTPLTSALSVRVHEESLRWRTEVETLGHRIDAIQESLPELERRAKSPARTEDDELAFRSALSARKLLLKQRTDLRGEHWIGVLEAHGLLPNYTLLDDTVTLDVSLSWFDTDVGDWRTEPYSYHRGAALALRDFAPGATFYAQGHQISIDAVDLGRDGEAAHRWCFCPACGFADRVAPGSAGIDACPRCGSAALADVKQRLDVVELDQVSAMMKRDEAMIDDARDDRLREPFDIVVAADIDPTLVSRRWYVDGYGFGVRYQKDLTIRWLNLGRSVGHGGLRTVAGQERNALLFRVCSECGQIDNATHRNNATEHRPWCSLRAAAEEKTRLVALSRILRTEGLVVRLPVSVSLGDSFATPSLAAALLLGLRDHIGGAPVHLAVELVEDPTPGGTDNLPALLLHDVVPGGTGYLAELAEPEMLRAVLFAAYEVVRDCPCRDEGRASCHRCLLPFAGPGGAVRVSRVAAERHLRDLLNAGTGSSDEPVPTGEWALTDDETTGFDPESHLEQKFRQVIRDRLKTAGATVDEKPGPNGNRYVITLGGGRVWTIDPQENVLGSRPDFALRSNDTTVPAVMIFCDGWRFHANPAINRLHDDVAKRARLREAGHVVIALTWSDLTDPPAAPPWFGEQMVGAVMGMSQGALTPDAIDLVRAGPLGWLIRWIQDPSPATVAALADWLPMFAMASSQHRGVLSGESAVQAAAGLLDGGALAGEPPTSWAWVGDTVALLARNLGTATASEVALVLDDGDHRLGQAHMDAWRHWLHLSNLLNLRTHATTITVTSLAGADADAGAAAGTDLDDDVPEELRADLAFADAGVRALVIDLHAAGVVGAKIGHEGPDGIPIDLAWPDVSVAVDIGLDDQDRSDLTGTGWRIVRPEIHDIRDALRQEEA